ncbi:MAG: hypothetical protein MJ107_04220 [Lachnospiraceae bacterium]|nr:hypothetical protein [Lachnospiraceae bacterium]
MSSLVAKRLEGYSGVLRDPNEPTENVEGESSGNGVDPLAMVALLADMDIDSDAVKRELSEELETGDVFESDDSEEGSFTQISMAEIGKEENDDVGETVEEMKARMLEEIEQIKSQALLEIDSYRDSTYEQAKQQGYSEGLSKGYQEYTDKLEELRIKEAQMQADYERALSEAEPVIVTTINSIYEKIFKSGLYCKDDVMTELINRALHNASRTDDVIIHVSTFDYEMISSLKDKLLHGLTFDKEPEIRADEQMTSGAAKVETLYGIMDCGIDTELDELRRMLHILALEVE